MVKKLKMVFLLLLSIVLIAGCASMKFVTEIRPAKIEQITQFRKLGLMVETVFSVNERLIVSINGQQLPVTANGIKNSLDVIMQAPEPFSSGPLNKPQVSQLITDLWKALLLDKEQYNGTLIKGFSSIMITNKKSGEPDLSASFDDVISVPAILENKLNSNEIQAIKEQYGIDGLLYVKCTINSDMVKALAPKENDTSMDRELVSDQIYNYIYAATSVLIYDVVSSEKIFDYDSKLIEYTDFTTPDKCYFSQM